MPFSHLFWLGGCPYENRQKQVGTLILTSLPEDLTVGDTFVDGEPKYFSAARAKERDV